MSSSARVFGAVLVVIAGVCIGGMAHAAATLFTPITARPTRASTIQCVATNVGKKEQTIQAKLISFDGTTVFKDSTPLLVPAGASLNPGETTQSVAYCKITTQGSKATVRGTILVLDQATGDIITQIPAQ